MAAHNSTLASAESSQSSNPYSIKMKTYATTLYLLASGNTAYGHSTFHSAKSEKEVSSMPFELISAKSTKRANLFSRNLHVAHSAKSEKGELASMSFELSAKRASGANNSVKDASAKSSKETSAKSLKETRRRFLVEQSDHR